MKIDLTNSYKKNYFSFVHRICWKKAFIIVFLAAIVSSAGFIYYCSVHEFREYRVSKERSNKPVDLSHLVKNYFNGVNSELPVLVIDIKFKDMKKLEAKRQEAFKTQVLIKEDDDYVPAVFNYNGRRIKAKVRLKGDWLDHLGGDKWSIRVNVKGDKSLFGMRRLSLQNPETKGFHYETLFHENMKKEGILAIRYFFVDVILNGDHIGTMAVEEHFSKELLESQKRREGVIVRFDESDMWDQVALNIKQFDGDTDGFMGFDDMHKAYVRPFREGSLQKSKKLSFQASVAAKYLRAVQTGDMKVEEVFDVDKLASFFALAQLWNSAHSIRWHNMRFYMNPVTMKLEPIAFDGNAHRYSEDNAGKIDGADKDWVFASPVFQEKYKSYLRKFTGEEYLNELEGFIKSKEEQIMPGLYKEYPALPAFDFSTIRRNAEGLRKLDLDKVIADMKYERHNDNAEGNIKFAHYILPYVIKDELGYYLEISNPIPRDVTVRNIYINGINRNDLMKDILPLKINREEKFSFKDAVKVRLDINDKEAEQVAVDASIDGDDEIHREAAAQYVAPGTVQVLPQSNVDLLLSKYSRLTLENGILKISKGKWFFTDSIILPREVSLQIDPGAVIYFEKNTGIISYSSLFFNGTQEEPIILQGAQDSEWQGIVQIGDGSTKVRWSNTQVKDTGFSYPEMGWTITGGVTLYRSDIKLKNCLFDKTSAEDAINTILSTFVMEAVEVRGSRSDAFDSDFSSGAVSNGSFSNIGGDGVDTSTSEVEVYSTKFANIHDKAMSAGERSNMTVRDVTVKNAGTGIASKDDSFVKISDSVLEDIPHVAAMAYTKKSEFGGSRLVSENVLVVNSGRDYIAQKRSSITVDGEKIRPEKINIDDIYKSGYMKK